MAGAVSCKQPTFVWAAHSVPDIPLNAGEAGAIGRVDAFLDHHDSDDISWTSDISDVLQWRGSARSPAKNVKYAARQFSLFKPAIRFPDPLGWNSLRLQVRSKQANGGVEMNEISANLAQLLLRSGDDARDLGLLRDQRGNTSWLPATAFLDLAKIEVGLSPVLP